MASRDLRIIVSTDTKGAVRGFARVDAAAGHGAKGLDRMKAAAMGAGVALAGLAAVGLKKSVDAAVDLGEEINKTRVVFRGSEKDILRWSKTTAASLGVSRREALQSAGVFGNMLVPMGFARDRAGEMSKKMVTLAADMASFNNASPAETLDALRAGLAGETEPLRRYGVFLNDARLKQEALNLHLKNAVGPNGALTTTAKAQATYSLILKDSGDAQGDFKRTSGSLANQQRVLKAEFEDVSAKLGVKLIPALTSAMKWLTKFVHQMETGKGAGGDFVDVLEEIVGSFVHFFRWTSNAIKNTNAWGDATRRHIIDVWRRVQKVVGDTMAGIFRGFAKLFDLASKLPGKVGDKFDDLQTSAEHAADKVDRLGEEIKQVKSKTVKITVKTAMQEFMSGEFKPLVPRPGQQPDGWGIQGKVDAAAQAWGRKQDPFGFPLGGGLLGGSADLMGANSNLGPFAALGSRMGLHVSSGYFGRENAITDSGNRSYHSMGRAIDMADGAPAMLAYAMVMAKQFGPRLKELIHTPLGFSIKNGQRVAPYSTAAHYNHVHVAMQRGGKVPGSGFGDKVPALLEPGEHIIRRSVAERIRPLLEALNVQKFSGGGEVLPRSVYAAINRAMTPDFNSWSKSTYNMTGKRLLAKVAAVEGGGSIDEGTSNTSSAGARGPFQFIASTRAAYMSKYHIDAWKNDYSAARAAMIHLKGTGVSGYNPGLAAYQGMVLGAAVNTDALQTGSVTARGGKEPLSRKERMERTPVKGRSTTDEIIGLRQDLRHESRWGALEGIRDDEVVTPRERKRADKAYGQRQKVLNQRIKAKRARLRHINAELKGKLKPATRKRLLAEKSQLISDIGGLVSESKSLTGEFQDLVAPFDVDTDTGGGGAGEPDTSAADLAAAVKELKAAIDTQTAYFTSVEGISSKVAIKFGADLISGQIAGQAGQRGRSAGDGITAATY